MRVEWGEHAHHEGCWQDAILKEGEVEVTLYSGSTVSGDMNFLRRACCIMISHSAPGFQILQSHLVG